MTEARKKPLVEVRPMTDENAEAVAEFFRAVWDADASPEKVRAGLKQATEGNPFFPGQASPIVLFLSDGRVLGYCGSIPIAVWSGGDEHRAEWIKGLMVSPEHRKGPIGFLLVKELMRRLEHPLSLVVGDAARRILGALGLTDLGLVPNFLRLLNTGAVLRKLDLEALGLSQRFPGIGRGVRLARLLKMSRMLGGCVDAGMRMKMTLTTASTRSLEVETSGRWPAKDELDCLWKDFKREITAACVRDGRYLTWRYGDSSVYGVVTARSEGQLRGIATVRRPRAGGDPRLKGIRVAVLSDLLFSPQRADTASALFRGAESVARNFGAEALLLSASHSAVVSLLPRHGYFRIPANMHFMLANKAGQHEFSCDLSSWWITRGDSSADEVF
jgi:GNAT superfamily N-acetyltransferase